MKQQFAQGEQAILQGVGVVTVSSWPSDEREGYAHISSFDDNGAETQSTRFVGEDAQGNPLPVSAIFTKYDGPKTHRTSAEVLDDVPGLDETPVVEDDAPADDEPEAEAPKK